MKTISIVLAAGASTRMKSRIPKVLHTLAGSTLLEHSLNAVNSISDKTILVAHTNYEQVESELLNNDQFKDVLIVNQQKLLGTGHAVKTAIEAHPELFTEKTQVIVTNADVPLLTKETISLIIENHNKDSASTVVSFLPRNPYGYGRIIRNQNNEFEEIIEQKDLTEEQTNIVESNSGIYVFEANQLTDAINKLTPSKSGEYYLTDVISILKSAKKSIQAFPIPKDLTWQMHGCNDQTQLQQARKIFNKQQVLKWQKAGVRIDDPNSTWIDAQVKLDSDVTILPGTFLYGKTKISGPNTIIGPATTIIDSVIDSGCSVVRSHVEGSTLDQETSIGPFSYLRPGTQTASKTKIGAFVESKNAKIGSGSKVPHLSYVGDIEIGRETNIGAGTIVVNYDGVNKHKTTVGDHVRVGANSSLVAPVNIGDGAYTGADTVVTKDVPAGSLAVSQGNKPLITEGWVAKKRSKTTKQLKDGHEQ